ncbi:ABC transporter permease, partial [Oscillospiraceae bacterium OttesenSCG-928-G22]|nr:ABC transporter permease [Oscillospiraceae bacterium OttesenSCG-928-G22]
MFAKKLTHAEIAAKYRVSKTEVFEPTNDRERRRDNFKKAWYRFSRNKLSVFGLILVTLIILCAVFAPVIAPYPEHAGAYTDFANESKPPSAQFPFGTDNVGRDILSRIIFSFRDALFMAALVLVISVPFGSFWGLVAGYMKGTIVETIIMRVCDIFLSVPAILMALAIASVLTPNLTNSMLAITVMWWPWYTRITYGVASS